ncbi:MAG: M56 family metallopeptidase [Pirellulaceae bacterium]
MNTTFSFLLFVSVLAGLLIGPLWLTQRWLQRQIAANYFLHLTITYLLLLMPLLWWWPAQQSVRTQAEVAASQVSETNKANRDLDAVANVPTEFVANELPTADSESSAAFQLSSAAPSFATLSEANSREATKSTDGIASAKVDNAGSPHAIELSISRMLQNCERAPVGRYLWLAWLIGIVLSLVRLAMGLLRCRQLVQRCRPNVDAGWHQTAETVAQRLKMTKLPVLCYSNEVGSPVVLRWPKPVVLLPESMSTANASERMATLLHEFAHLRYRHHWHHMAAGCLQTLYWFHPFVHWLQNSLAAAMEEWTDNVALDSISANDYAQSLLNVAVHRRRTALPLACGMLDGRMDLEKRIARLLNHGRNTSYRLNRRLLTFGCVTAFGISWAATLLAAAMQTAPSSESVSTSFADWERSPGNEQEKDDASSLPNQDNSTVLADFLPDATRAFVEFRHIPEKMPSPTNRGEMISRSAWIKSQVHRYLGVPYGELAGTLEQTFDVMVEQTQGRICVAVVDSARQKNLAGQKCLAFVSDAYSEQAAGELWQEMLAVAKPAVQGMASEIRGPVLMWSYHPTHFSIDSILPAQRLRTARMFGQAITKADEPTLVWYRDAKWLSSRDNSFAFQHLLGLLFRVNGNVDPRFPFKELASTCGSVQFPLDGPESLTYRTLVELQQSQRMSTRPPGVLIMSQFENMNLNVVPDWVPRNATFYASFGWDLGQLDSLLDALVKISNFTESVLESIRDDPNGPGVDLRNDFFPKIGKQWHAFTIANSESTDKTSAVLAVNVSDEDAVKSVLERLFKNDSECRRFESMDCVFWELAGNDASNIPVTCLTVAHGHLFVADCPGEMLADVISAKHANDRLASSNIVRQLEQVLPTKPLAIRSFASTGDGLQPPFRIGGDAEVRLQSSVLTPTAAPTVTSSVSSLLPEAWCGFLWRPYYGQPVARPAAVPDGPSVMSVETIDDGWLIEGAVLRMDPKPSE